MTSILNASLEYLKCSTILSPRIISVIRTSLLNVFGQIHFGRLKIHDHTTNEVYECGSDSVLPGCIDRKPLKVELYVKNKIFWVRLLIQGDIGFAESYMLSEVDCDDLTGFFKIFIYNSNLLSNSSSVTSYLLSRLSGLFRATNSLSNAASNIIAHYDISNDIFAAFLTSDMTYSCPIWPSISSNESISSSTQPDMSLEAAQLRKIDYLLDLLRIQPNDHILEIGTGWGSLAIRAVQRFDCYITSLTLSREQKSLAEQRVQRLEAKLASRITIVLGDYRDLVNPQTKVWKKVWRRNNPQGIDLSFISPHAPHPPQLRFDRLVSCEMLEAVGAAWLVTYFDVVNQCLKQRDGIAVFQCITIPDARYTTYAATDDFIRRYIFPGGHLPSISLIIKSIEVGSHGTLIPESLRNIGPHYTRCLRLWGEKFEENFDSKIAPALLARRAASPIENGCATPELKRPRHHSDYHDDDDDDDSTCADLGYSDPEMISTPNTPDEETPSNQIEHDKQPQEDNRSAPLIEVFRRKWRYYFRYCEAGFATRTLGDAIICVVREGAMFMDEDIPR